MRAHLLGFGLGFLVLLGASVVASLVGGAAFMGLFDAGMAPRTASDLAAVLGIAVGAGLTGLVLSLRAPVPSRAGAVLPFFLAAAFSIATGPTDPRSWLSLVPALAAAWVTRPGARG